MSQMKPFLQVADQYYVLATSVLADRENRVLKQGETFAIFDTFGDIQPVTHTESGVFHRGTRYLSDLEFNINDDERPLLLNSTLRDDNGILKVDMTNPDFTLAGFGFVPKGTLRIHREVFLLDSCCFTKFTVTNFGRADLEIDASVTLGADFADIFEVRGTKRAARGEIFKPALHGQKIIMAYRGLDGIRRDTHVGFSVSHFTFDEKGVVRFTMRIPRRGTFEADLTIQFFEAEESVEWTWFDQCVCRVSRDHQTGRGQYCTITSSNDEFNTWLKRSTDDLVMMTTRTDNHFLYPFAGIPWYCTPFGRDGIITALECSWANPALAKGVLGYLAKTQALERIPEIDSAPGKIIHESRKGEMANLKEIPFGMYYGSVDSTPLFICLAGAYYRRTADLEFVRSIWTSIERALQWMDQYGDADGDGFLEYQRESPRGLRQQGWKDSHDSVFHADDSDAEGAIALCEVQGYAYMARHEGAALAEALGHTDLAAELRREAEVLKNRFDDKFWLDDIKTYALALDGNKRPCRVSSSNAGQCLFTGIVKPERRQDLVNSLMRPESFCGWGIRTIASDVIRYNPMSYHNGSVWPHDTALIAWGLGQHGYKDSVERIFEGLFRASGYMELKRMPEVFCGFSRKEGEAPTLYPHACSPQAWAAAGVYLLIQSMLGISIDAVRRRVHFAYPSLPQSIDWLNIENLPVGGYHVDLVVQSYKGRDVSVQITRREGGISVIVEK
jgi:glycogen debranching enzyme